jgi:hypothetical protein
VPAAEVDALMTRLAELTRGEAEAELVAVEEA